MLHIYADSFITASRFTQTTSSHLTETPTRSPRHSRSLGGLAALGSLLVMLIA